MTLLVPSLWFLASRVSGPADENFANSAVHASTIFVGVVGPVYMAWMTISIIKPSFAEQTGRTELAVLGPVVLFASTVDLVGSCKDLVPACDDVEVSGNHPTDNCRSGTETPNPEP